MCVGVCVGGGGCLLILTSLDDTSQLSQQSNIEAHPRHICTPSPMFFKPLLHDQIFFHKFHVSIVFWFFDRVNWEFLTNLSKNPNLHGQKVFDI